MTRREGLDALTIVWLCFNYIIIVPISAHFAAMFWKNRTLNMIHLRRPKLIHATNCYIMYFLIIHGPIYLIVIDLYRDVMVAHLICFVIDSIGYEIGFTLYLWRSWHVYYDINFNHIEARNFWAKMLNSEAQEGENFFIKHRNTLGNFKYTVKIIIGYFICYVIGVCVFTFVVSFEAGEIFSMIILLMILLPFLWIFYQIGSNEDGIHVRSELLLGVSVLFIVDIIDVGLLITLQGVGHFHTILVLDYIVPTVGFCLVILISTGYVFWKCNLRDKLAMPTYYRKSTVIAQPKMISSSSSPVNEDATVGKSKSKKRSFDASTATRNEAIDVISIISTQEGFHIFMNYLVSEYAFENLLFVVEVTQFKSNAVSKLVDNEERSEIEENVLKLPDSVPIGDTIVGGKSIQTQFVALYDKYIDRAKSTWEVNISSSARKRLVKLYGKLSNDQFCIVDEVSPKQVNVEKEKEKEKQQEENDNEENEENVDNSGKTDTKDKEDNDDKDSEKEKEKEKEKEQEIVGVRARKESHFIEGTDTNDVSKQIPLIQVIKVFDGAMYDVIKCLKDSFSRFNTTETFEQFTTKRSPKGSSA